MPKQVRESQIDRPNLNLLVCEKVRNMIVTGRHHVGEKLSEIDLSTKLGVSRTPVKLAFVELAKEGLVEMVPRRGAFVAGITYQDEIELLEIREKLDSLVAQRAAEHRTSEQASALQRIIEEQEEILRGYLERGDAKTSIEDYYLLTEKDRRFHDLLVEASGSRQLAMILTRNSVIYKSFVFRVERNPVVADFELIIREHEAIASAVAEGDGRKAAELSARHVARTKEGIMAELTSKESTRP